MLQTWWQRMRAAYCVDSAHSGCWLDCHSSASVSTGSTVQWGHVLQGPDIVFSPATPVRHNKQIITWSDTGVGQLAQRTWPLLRPLHRKVSWQKLSVGVSWQMKKDEDSGWRFPFWVSAPSSLQCFNTVSQATQSILLYCTRVQMSHVLNCYLLTCLLTSCRPTK